MVDDKRVNYPCIPEKYWWILREKFKESVPSELSKFYVSNILNISPQTAWDNVIRQMRMIGLIDDRGKPTDLGHKWKDDKKYKNVCTRIIKKLYPRELTELFPNSSAPSNEVAKWFKDICLCEGSFGKACAEFYLMLMEGNPSWGEEVLTDPNKPSSKKPGRKADIDQSTVQENLGQTGVQNSPPLREDQSSQPPAIHIDFHIHISPETTPEMVDKIFKKIARHLNSFQAK